MPELAQARGGDEARHPRARDRDAPTQVSENVGLCSTYSIRTRSGPQTKTASVFGASTTLSISTPRSRAAATCSSAESTRTARWLRSGRSGAPGSPGWNSIHAPPTSTRGQPDAPGGAAPKPSEPYSDAVACGIGGAERDVVEVVVEVGVGLDETERDAFAELEVRLALAPPLDLEAVRQLGQRPLEIVHPQRDVLERAALARAFGCEERQLPAPRVGADERERVGPVDHVHPEMRDAKSATASRSASQ